MSAHGECFDIGMSGSCNIDECGAFFSGDCPRPEEMLGNEGEENLTDEDWQQVREVYPGLYKKLKEEIVMSESKLFVGQEMQRNDRMEATKKLEALCASLSNNITKPEVFHNDNCEEVFNEVVLVPVRVVCFNNNGARKVYVNAFGADGTKLSTVVSKELIECFVKLSEKVVELDSGLGCENLSKLL